MQTRDFTYVDDTVDATIDVGLKCNGSEIINIAKGEDITMLELANKIKSITNSKSKIKLVENPSFRKDYEVEKGMEVAKKLISLVGKKPEISLDEGLVKTYNYILSKNEKN